MTATNFINDIVSVLKTLTIPKGIYPSMIIAQACLESGYGTSELARNANNFYGLNQYGESFTSQYGTYIINAPQEYNGSLVYREEKFCVFDSMAESTQCLFDWYNPNNRLKYAGLYSCTCVEDACRFIQQAGYATDSNYANKLISIINRYNLKEYDKAGALTDYTGRYIYVYCGSFEVRDNADARVNYLLDCGISSFVKHANNGNYRVQVGCFEIKDNANAYMAYVKKHSGCECFCEVE